MGSLIAPFDDKGVLQTRTTSGDSLKKNAKNKNTVDSDMFLTLLVAEMQNQDPLEPTSNTEWVSQYATFTQVQKMSEMAEAVDVLRANELIGKEVIVKTTSESTGEVNYKQGIVDFVEIENGKPLLVIDDAKYSIDDLDTIVSSEYSAAYEKYSTFKGMIDSLPDVAYADSTYKNVIQGAFDYYNTMDDYQKNYMKIYGSDQMEKFTQWKLELENMGVKFTDSSVEEEEDKKASLDDILESFNTKVNAILDKLTLLTEMKAAADEKDANQPEEGPGSQPGDGTVGSAGEEPGDGTVGSTGEEPGGQTGDAGSTGEEPGDQTGNVGSTGEEPGGQTGNGTVGGTGEEPGSQTGNGTVGSTGEEPGGQTGDTDSTGEVSGAVGNTDGENTGNTDEGTGGQTDEAE